MDALKLLVGQAITGISGAAAGVSDSLKQSIDASTQSQTNNSGLLQAILTDQAALAKTVTTGGQSDTNKTLLTGAAIAAAALVAVFYFTKK